MQRLAELVEQSGLERSVLADVLSISPSMLSKMLTGERGGTLETFASIADKLGVRMGWLYGVETNPKFNERIESYRAHVRKRVREVSLPDMALPTQRIVLCIDLVREIDPDALPTWFLSLHFGLRPQRMEMLLADKYAITDNNIHRAAELFALPRRWFFSGEIDDLAPIDLGEYADFIDIMRSNGISADFLHNRVDLIKHLKSIDVPALDYKR